MSKREDKKKLELRRQRLQQLTSLSDDQIAQVAGGGDENGRVRSRCCA